MVKHLYSLRPHTHKKRVSPTAALPTSGAFICVRPCYKEPRLVRVVPRGTGRRKSVQNKAGKSVLKPEEAGGGLRSGRVDLLTSPIPAHYEIMSVFPLCIGSCHTLCSKSVTDRKESARRNLNHPLALPLKGTLVRFLLLLYSPYHCWLGLRRSLPWTVALTLRLDRVGQNRNFDSLSSW